MVLKLFSIIWKEISLIKSQKIALMLIFIYPFISIALLAMSFSGSGLLASEVKIGLINNLDFNTGISSSFNDINGFQVIEYSSEENLISDLRNGTILVGLRATGTSEYSRINCDIYYDNSSIFASQVFVQVAQAMVRGIAANAVQSRVAEMLSLITDAKSDLSSQVSDFNILRAKIDNLSTNIDLLERDLNSINFVEIDKRVDLVKKVYSGPDLDYVVSNVTKAKVYILQLKSMIAESKASESEIREKLDKAEALITEFSAKFSEIEKISPEVISQPIIFKEKPIFSTNTYGILASNAIVVVLVMTCMLLTALLVILERNQNVSLRMNMAPTSKFTLFTGKVIGQLLIAIIEATIIIGVVVIGFGVQIIVPLWLLFLGIVLISLSFISLGLLIAFFTSNPSTAILLSLLGIVSMLFLSGIIVPLELMASGMKFVSTLLPMSISNALLISLLVKNATLSEVIIPLALLTTIVVLIASLVLSKKEY